MTEVKSLVESRAFWSALLALAVAGIWLLNFLDEKRKIQSCIEAGRRDCLRTYDPAAAPPK